MPLYPKWGWISSCITTFLCVICKTILFSERHSLFISFLQVEKISRSWSGYKVQVLTSQRWQFHSWITALKNVKLFHEKYIWRGTDNGNVWTSYKKEYSVTDALPFTCANAKITRWKRKSDIWLFQFRTTSVDSNILCIILIPIIFLRSTL